VTDPWRNQEGPFPRISSQEEAPGEGASERVPDLPPPLERVIEALLFIGGAPLTPEIARAAVRGMTPGQLSETVDLLNREYRYQGRPYSIQPQEHGYVLTLRPRFRSVIERLYGQARAARLSPAAIDVLSLVAYRQPVTKLEIEGVRGAESGNLLRQLVRRGLLAIVQSGPSLTGEVAYGTTPRFLELFKLLSLEDLPQTLDLQRL
jgi:segregation and condensation protein B